MKGILTVKFFCGCGSSFNNIQDAVSHANGFCCGLMWVRGSQTNFDGNAASQNGRMEGVNMNSEFSKVVSDALTSAYSSGFKAGMDFVTVGKGVNHDAQRPKRKYKPRKKAAKKALPK